MKTNEEIMKLYKQHEKYIEATIRKRFYNKNLQALHGITNDELFQSGRLGLYRACKEYNPDKNASFKSFAISNIFWSISTECKKLSRDTSWNFDTINRVSLDHTIPGDTDEEATMYDAIPDPVSSEAFNSVVYEDNLNSIRNKVSPQVHQIVELRLEGYTNQEIADMLEITHQRVSYLLRHNKDKITSILVG